MRVAQVAGLSIQGRWHDDGKVVGMTWVGRWYDDTVADMTIQRVAGLTMVGKFGQIRPEGRWSDDIVFSAQSCYAEGHGQDN